MATSPPISFQSCLAIFKSTAGLSLGLESQSPQEHSVCVSCHGAQPACHPLHLKAPHLLRLRMLLPSGGIQPGEMKQTVAGKAGREFASAMKPSCVERRPQSGISQLAGGFIHGTVRHCWLIHHQYPIPALPPQQLFSSTHCLVFPSLQQQVHQFRH